MAVIATLALFTAAGASVLWFSGVRSTESRLIGESFLTGALLVTLMLLVQSLAGVAWSRAGLLMTLVAIAVLRWLPWSSRFGVSDAPLGQEPVETVDSAASEPARVDGAGSAPLHWFRMVVLILVCVIVAGHGKRTVATAGLEQDFVAIWGLKAKTFAMNRGIDWSFLRDPENITVQPDYPPLLPLADAAVAVVIGGWPSAAIGLVSTAFGVATLLVIRGRLRLIVRDPLLLDLSTLAITAPCLTIWIGLGEAPLAAFMVAGLIRVAEALESGDRRAGILGGLFLGAAALTKNEGIALVAAACLVVVSMRFIPMSRVTRLAILSPAVFLAALWLVIVRLQGLSSYLGGSLSGNLLINAPRWNEIASALVSFGPPKPLYYLATIVVILALWRRIQAPEAMMLSIGLLLLGAYVSIYFITPFDPIDQIRYSWGRILEPPGLILGLVAVSLVGRSRRSEPAPESEPAPGL